MEEMQRDELSSMEARQLIAEAQDLVNAGRLGAAAHKCERMLKLAPNWREALCLYGSILEQMGLDEKAGALYDQATRPDAISQRIEDPEGLQERPQELLEKAHAAWEAGHMGSALRACEKALALDPDWAEAHNLRGVVLDAMGQTGEAVAAYRRALRLAPGLEDARANLREAQAELHGREDDLDWVVIRRYSFPSEAEIALGHLQAEDIPATVIQEEITTIFWFFSNMVGGVKLCVPEDDVERALAVLEGEPLPRDAEERCPRCGSSDVAFARYNLRWVYLTILLLRFPLPIRNSRWVCHSCGATWAESDG